MMSSEVAYAKVNLALHVRARRDDGYHRIESLFAFAEQGDVLTAQAAEAITLAVDGPFAAGLDSGADNLVVRAAYALQEAASVKGGADIRLTKNLPIAAGIGGGSADAAACLRLLCRLWEVTLPPASMHALALALGSDVPACLASRTQFVGGRGETLDIRNIDGLPGMAMLLVNPGVAVSTGAVFEKWDGIDRGPLDATDLQSLIASGRNDLSEAAVAMKPVIADVLDYLAVQPDVELARMSGSGATCFALFDNEQAMADAAKRLRGGKPDWWIMEMRVRG